MQIEISLVPRLVWGRDYLRTVHKIESGWSWSMLLISARPPKLAMLVVSAAGRLLRGTLPLRRPLSAPFLGAWRVPSPRSVSSTPAAMAGVDPKDEAVFTDEHIHMRGVRRRAPHSLASAWSSKAVTLPRELIG